MVRDLTGRDVFYGSDTPMPRVRGPNVPKKICDPSLASIRFHLQLPNSAMGKRNGGHVCSYG